MEGTLALIRDKVWYIRFAPEGLRQETVVGEEFCRALSMTL